MAIVKKAARKNGVNFTNIIRAAFTCADSKSAKKYIQYYVYVFYYEIVIHLQAFDITFLLFRSQHQRYIMWMMESAAYPFGFER
jgi:hypothetical protein